MRIDKLNYVDKAEQVIKSLQKENRYGEKELNAALQNIAGIVTECLVAKKCALDTIVLEKIIGEERKILLHYHMEEFSYCYVIRNL